MLFLEIAEFPSNTVKGEPREASVSKTSSNCSAVFLQCQPVMEIGWFGAVRGNTRSLEIVPFDRVLSSY